MALALTPDLSDSPAVALLFALECDGFRVELGDDAAVVIAPRSRLTPERMAAIVACKDALKALLRGVQNRRDVFRAQLAATPPPAAPPFLYRADVPYVAGKCFSCGDALPTLRFGRCWRCSLAWRLAARVPMTALLADALAAAKILT